MRAVRYRESPERTARTAGTAAYSLRSFALAFARASIPTLAAVVREIGDDLSGWRRWGPYVSDRSWGAGVLMLDAMIPSTYRTIDTLYRLFDLGSPAATRMECGAIGRLVDSAPR